MNDVSQQCISLANGALSPDQRVNYEFGLVLGVNEFRQEQEYFLEKNYLYNRELHGFGTVSGLKVTLQTPSDNPNEREIIIKPGVAVDQWGRSIVVRNTLCAHLQAWLAKQDQDTNTLNHVANHLDADGNGHVYIVASYQACPDALVPVPGQGCNSEATRAASRIRDSYTIELTWTKPALPAWDAEHCFAQLLAQIRLMPETSVSDEQKIIEYVRQLDKPCPEAFPGTLSQDFLQLPAFGAREALDRIFAVWVTEVRPRLHPDLLNPDGNVAADNPVILLAGIDLALQKGTATNSPWQISSAQLGDEQRPFLLNTQLMQETILQSKQPEPEREFATFQVRDDHTLRLWVHYPDPVLLHPPITGDLAQLQVQSEDKTLTIQNVLAVPNTSNVFDITVNEVIVSGARLTLTFTLNAIHVGDNQDNSPLLQSALETLNFSYVGHDRVANTISVYVERETTSASKQSEPEREFATFQVRDDHTLRLWVHYPSPVLLNDASTQLQVQSEDTTLPISAIAGVTDTLNVFDISLGGAALVPGARLAITFMLGAIHISDNQGDSQTLQSMLETLNFLYVGHDLVANSITVYTIAEFIPVQIVPVQPFVTVTRLAVSTVPTNVFTGVTFELWFHPNLEPDSNNVFMQDISACTAIIERGSKDNGAVINQTIVGSDSQQNVFTLTLTPRHINDNSPNAFPFPFYLRLVFPVDQLKVHNAVGQTPITLREYMQGQKINFEGYNGNDAIISYVSVHTLS